MWLKDGVLKLAFAVHSPQGGGSFGLLVAKPLLKLELHPCWTASLHEQLSLLCGCISLVEKHFAF